MYFEKLFIKNFRRHEELTLELSDINRISGRNGAGKSSVGEAIIWLMEGTDEFGVGRQDARLKRAGANEMRVGGVFRTDSGQKVRVERIRIGDKTDLKVKKRTGNKGMKIFLGFLLILALVAIYGLLWSTNFLLYSYGFVFLAVFFFAGSILFLLRVDRRQGINPEKGPIKRCLFILGCLGLAIFAGYSSWLNIGDVPDYVKGHYLTVSGTPSFVDYTPETNSQEIDIKGHDLTLKARKISETHYTDYTYTFAYLPRSGFIVKCTGTPLNS